MSTAGRTRSTFGVRGTEETQETGDRRQETGVQELQEFRSYWSSGFTGVAGVQEFRSSGVQEFRRQEFRSGEIWVESSFDFRGSPRRRFTEDSATPVAPEFCLLSPRFRLRPNVEH